MLIPNNSAIPSTSTKLNFYLAQINRNGHKKDNHSPYANKSMQYHHMNTQKINKSMDNHPFNENTKFKINFKKNTQDKYRGNNYLNDSLDVLMTDRENIDTILLSPKNSKNNPNTLDYNLSNLSCESRIFSNHYSDFDQFSPKSNRIQINQSQYYDQTQIKPVKRVNWNLKPKERQRINKNNLKMDSNFKQISNHLSKLTVELNKNSKKLEQINRFRKCENNSNPQQSLKRANLKYAAVNVSQENSGIDIKHRPYIKYEDKVYRDPRYLIWQPLHPSPIDNKSFHS